MDFNKKKTVEINRADSISKSNGDIEAIIIYSLISVCMVSYYIVRNYFGDSVSDFIVVLNRILLLSPLVVLLVYFFIGAIQLFIGFSKSDDYDIYCGRKRMIISLISSIICFVFFKLCNLYLFGLA